MDGWIKLHREIIDHWIYKDAEYLKVWIEMLIRARYWDESSMELVGDQLIEVGRGEFIFGRPKWSQRLGISEQRLKTLIQKMLKDSMIELVQKYPRFTLYRIKNYEKFNQQDNQETNQQGNQQESAPQQAEIEFDNQQDNHDSNQQSNQRATSSQPAANQQPTNNKESKERSKNDKKEKKKDIKINTFSAYTSNTILVETLESFLEYRKKIKKPMTGKAVDLLLNKLDKLAGSDEEKIAMLENSILNGWQSVYALKDKGGGKVATTRERIEDTYAGIDFGF